MSAQDKLAIGMTAFAAFFLIALLLVPASLYRSYREDVVRRKRHRVLQVLMTIVMLLALPYFYDELVGLDNPHLSRLIEWTIGACTYLVILDIVCFLYRRFGPPARRSRLN